MVKDAFSKSRESLTRKQDGSKQVKYKKIVKTLIWSVALYCAETWSLRIDSGNMDMGIH